MDALLYLKLKFTRSKAELFLQEIKAGVQVNSSQIGFDMIYFTGR